MGSIDNILGKVDTLMKKTDRFLEEHLPEEPPIDYEKEGVNMEHLFVFTDTTMTYNGKPFMPGMSIGELCEIFGHYERLAEPELQRLRPDHLVCAGPHQGPREGVELLDGERLEQFVDLHG